MSWHVALGLLLALGSAGALNWSYLAQHGATAALPALSVRRPLRSLRLLFTNRRWLIGLLVGVAGWMLYVSALTLAPLSLVQATAAGGIGLLALLISRTTSTTLSRREWRGVLIAVGGLVLLALTLAHGSNSGSRGAWPTIALWLAASAGAAAVAAGPAARMLVPGAGFGVGAGILYAAGDVGTKAAVAGGQRLLFVPPLLACHLLAFVLLQLGFQRGSALATAGVASLFTNALPIAAGIAIFGEQLPPGPLGVLRATAFAVVAAGAALLARPEAA